jgi:hypothetical protein
MSGTAGGPGTSATESAPRPIGTSTNSGTSGAGSSTARPIGTSGDSGPDSSTGSSGGGTGR